MPRQVSPLMRQLYERANANACDMVEVAQPDVGLVFRRWPDQFSVNPPRLSETPAGSTQQDPGGGMMLTAMSAPLVALYTDSGSNRIPMTVPDQSRILRGVGWTIDQALKPLRLRRVTVKISNNAQTTPTNLELQIYRMRGVPGNIVNDATGKVIAANIVQLTPTPLLPQPARVNVYSAITAPNMTSDVVFDLTAFQFDVEHRNVPSPNATQAGELPELLFEVWLTNPAANNVYRWQVDTTSAHVYAGIGSFYDVTWERRLPNGSIAPDPSNPQAAWVRAQQNQCPCIKLDIDTYPATSQEVYALTLPRAPIAASTGRARFVRENFADTSTVLEVATAGSSGPWTPVTDGSVIATKQANYWLRTTMNASGDGHRSPVIEAIGIEFRTPVDVSAEATLDAVPCDVNVPFLDAAIGEGKATLMRTGRVDYHDPGSDLMAASAATQLELDHWVGSRHPQATRDDWLRMARVLITSAEPALTTETLSLLSYLKTTKRKIPVRAEVINQVCTVGAGTNTASTITVVENLQGTSAGGNEYDNLNYYIRIRSTAVAGLAPGMLFTVAGNTGVHQLDLVIPAGSASAMVAALAVGDTIEVHSGTYQQPRLTWTNADPSDVWWEILTVRLGIPPERIGLAALGRAGRAGLPPKVTDRAPGDAATQAKLKVSRQITEQTEGKALIDQLSFLMQGATIEVEGQIVFVQIYDLLDPNGNVVMPPPEVAATFDVREHYNLQTPRGLESRVTTCACDYGVDTTLGSDAPKPSTLVFSDADAVAWYTQQDLEEIGNSTISSDVAQWCYNSTDGGRYLAQIACQQVVRTCSTGLRVWSWRAVEMHPDLLVGDRVVVITDQYTDYDPTTKVSIRGLWAFPLVLVHVGDRGRDLRGFMLGLFSAVPVVGGVGKLSVGLVGQPSIGAPSFDASGNLLVSVNMGSPPGAGFRIAASAFGMPTDTAVDGTIFIPGTTAAVNLGAGWASGVTVQIKVIAYASSDTTGPRSIASTIQAKAPGGVAGSYTSVTQGAPNFAANTIPLSWVWSGGAVASENVWVSEAGRPFGLWASGVLLQPVSFGSDFDLVASGGNFTDTVVVFIEALDGSGHVIARSAYSSVSYSANR